MSNDKAQASLEYLASYAWAILAFLVVIGVIILFFPPAVDTNVCTINSEVRCVGYHVGSNETGTYVRMRITNMLEAAADFQINATNPQTGSEAICSINNNGLFVEHGENMDVECIFSKNYNYRESVRIELKVAYKKTGSTTVHVIQGEIRTRVEQLK